MAADRSKPGPEQTPATEAPERVSRNSSGRVTHDDRGNAVWEWSVATGAFGHDPSTERLKRLESDALSIAEDAPSPFEIAKPNPHGVLKGYNPYESGRLGKPADAKPAKKTDLRKLSEWMKLKKQYASRKDEE
jgi:hypothetical protein